MVQLSSPTQILEMVQLSDRAHVSIESQRSEPHVFAGAVPLQVSEVHSSLPQVFACIAPSQESVMHELKPGHSFTAAQ